MRVSFFSRLGQGLTFVLLAAAPRGAFAQTTYPPPPVAPATAPAPAPAPQPAAAPAPQPPPTAAPEVAPPPAAAAPEPAPAAPPPPAAEPPPAAAPAPSEEAPAEEGAPADKRTFFFGPGIGLELCYTGGCSDDGRSVGLGPVLNFAFGIRPVSFLAFTGDALFAAHGISLPAPDNEGAVRNLAAYGGIRVYPIELGSLEPWIGASLGFHQYTEKSGSSAPFDDRFARQIRTIGSRFQIGLDIPVAEWFAFGPYVSWDPSYGGVSCTKLGADGANCTALSSTGRADPPGTINLGDQPQFISFGAQAQVRLELFPKRTNQ